MNRVGFSRRSSIDCIRVAALAIASGIGSAERLGAQCARNEDQKLVASDGAAEDRFGSSVSMSGNVAVVGARGDDDGGIKAGSAYIYRWDGSSWVEEVKLTASDAAASDDFGFAVAMSDEIVAMGAYGNDNDGKNQI